MWLLGCVYLVGFDFDCLILRLLISLALLFWCVLWLRFSDLWLVAWASVV